MESLVTGLKEVTGCKIIADPEGRITDINVTTESENPPRFVARDVQVLLQVREGLNIDRRKIMVAVTKAGLGHDCANEAQILKEIPAAMPQEQELIIEEEKPEPQRVLYDKITVTHQGGRVRAEVSLSRDGRKAVGEASSADTGDGHLSAVVQATLAGMLQLFQPGIEFADPLFEIIPFGREEVMVVYLSAVEGRSIQAYTGSAVIRQDTRQAAILATLSALNRVTGLWPEQGGLDFEIV